MMARYTADGTPSTVRNWSRTPMLALVLLFAIAAMAMVTSALEEDVELTDVTYFVSDGDGDGFDDTVTITATVHNTNDQQSKAFTVEVLLEEGANQVDLRTDGGILAANETRNVTVVVGTDTDSTSVTYTVRVILHAGDLTGEVVDSQSYSADLHPRGEYQLTVMVDPTTRETLENTTVDFTLTVGSLSNNPTGAEFNVSTVLGWTFVLEGDDIQLDPDETAVVGLSVSVPPNTPAGSREVLDIEVRSTRNGTAFVTATVSVTVALQTFSLDMTLDETEVYVASGDTVTVEGTVTNGGNNVDNVTLMADVLPGWTAEFVPPFLLLARGTVGTFALHLTPPAGLKESGSSLMNVTALSSGLVVEAVTGLTVVYNTAEISLRGDFDITPSMPVSGEGVTLQAPVRNLGSVIAENILVVVISDGEELARTFIDSIPPGGTGVATLTWTAAPGSQLLRIVADPDNDIPETDEGNNEATWTLSVTSPDLSVTTQDIIITPDYPTEGTETTILLTVTNLVMQSAGPFEVTLAVEGDPLDTFSVETGLAGGANVTLEATWTAAPGRSEFTVVVDPLGQVPEGDLTNNEASRTFSVNSRPTATLEVHMTELEIGETAVLDAGDSSDPDGRVRQYFFDYGDGTDSGWVFSPTINHTYGQTGEFEVRVYVRDEGGAQNEDPAVVTITVAEPDTGDGNGTPGLSVPTVMAALALVAVLVVLSTRRRAGEGS
jgi:uncharacterized membrane protein